jgi:hypothetical protein
MWPLAMTILPVQLGEHIAKNTQGYQVKPEPTGLCCEPRVGSTTRLASRTSLPCSERTRS